MATAAAARTEEIGFASRDLFGRSRLQPRYIQRMEPGRQPRHLGLRQVREGRHGALAAANDGGNPGRIQGAKMDIIDQRGRAVAAARILAVAAGAGGIEISYGLGSVRGTEGRFLGPDMGGKLEQHNGGGAGRCQGQGKFLHRISSHFWRVQVRLGWSGERFTHL